MSQAPKLRKEQLQRGYRAPHARDGARVALPGSRLVTRPAFTTSAKANEAQAEDRKAQGAYFGDRIKVISNTDTPTQEPWKQNPKQLGACKPIPNGGVLKVARPINLETDAMQVYLGSHKAINMWSSLLAQGVPIPLEVAAALRFCHDFPIYDLRDD